MYTHNSFHCICQHCRYKAESKQKGAILIVFTVYVDTVDTNKIPYSIHNSIALIFCIDCLNMSFNVQTTDKVTGSGFLTI